MRRIRLPRIPSPWLMGLAAPLLFAEVALRLLAPSLPSPAPWPSVGIESKTEAAAELADEGVDVVFLGSSVSEAGIDPAILDREYAISAFNGAGPYSTPVSMATWLDRSMWSLEPRTLVIGLPIWGAPDDRSSDVLEAGFAELASFEETDDGLLGRSELWSRRGQLRQALDLVADSVNATTYTDRGHLTYYHERTAPPREPVEGNPFPGFSADNVEALEAIVDGAAARGTRVLLLLEPGGCPGIVPDCADDNSEEAARNALTRLGAELSVALVDGRVYEAPERAYADAAHFNRIGTEGFTRFLGDLLTDVR